MISASVYPLAIPCKNRNASLILLFPEAFVPTSRVSDPSASSVRSKFLNRSKRSFVNSIHFLPEALSALHKQQVVLRWLIIYSASGFLNTNTPFIPPKPNEFDIATWSAAGRAWLGT